MGRFGVRSLLDVAVGSECGVLTADIGGTA